MHHRLEHGDLDQLALAGAAALDQGAGDAEGGVDAGLGVGHGRAQQARIVRVGGDPKEARQRLGHRVVAGAGGIGAVRAEAGDGAVDQPRIDGAERLPVRAHARGGARAEVLDVDVGLLDQLAEHARVGRLLEVQGQAALAAVIGLEVRAIEAAAEVAVGVADARRLHLDHVSADVGEHHGAAGTGDEGALLEDADAIEGLGHLPIPPQFSP